MLEKRLEELEIQGKNQGLLRPLHLLISAWILRRVLGRFAVTQDFSERLAEVDREKLPRSKIKSKEGLLQKNKKTSRNKNIIPIKKSTPPDKQQKWMLHPHKNECCIHPALFFLDTESGFVISQMCIVINFFVPRTRWSLEPKPSL